ncbi:hypothetical protein TNCV_3162411 [Trichonephila clavipes]|nr:hypothetical protein TNCV_3162411 [Trichonephila clavipes]
MVSLVRLLAETPLGEYVVLWYLYELVPTSCEDDRFGTIDVIFQTSNTRHHVIFRVLKLPLTVGLVVMISHPLLVERLSYRKSSATRVDQ